MEYIPIVLIFIPIISAICIYMFHNKYINYLAYVAELFIGITSIYYFNFLKETSNHVVFIGGWSGYAGIALKNDWLSISTIFLVVLIWSIILLYSWSSRGKDSIFIFLILFLQGIFIGLVQSNDLFNMFIFIELATIISSILIVYKKDGYSLKAGIFYLLFNSIGIMFFLLGMLLIYMLTGTLNMDITKDVINSMDNTIAIKAAYIFIISAVGVKSAFFPVFNWLPKAHGAATSSVSALLSGVLVKSGLYAFIRINNIFSIDILNEFFLFIGFLTAFSGMVFAISQKDIKQILAFSTISQVGVILIALSRGEGYSFYGGIVHLFNHAFFKSLLFLSAGIIVNEYGTKNIDEIKGVFKRLPATSVFMIIGIISITGAPLLNGAVSKTIMLYSLSPIEAVFFNIINLGTVVYFIKLSKIFFGDIKIRSKVSLNCNLALVLLSFFCIILGLFYKSVTSVIWPVDFYLIRVLEIDKFVIYVINIVLGYLIYDKIISKEYKLIKKIRKINITFETANVMLLMFISIMIFTAVFIKG